MIRTLALALVLVAGCAARPSPEVPHTTLVAPAGDVDARALAARARFTVFVFFSAHCPTQRAHDARLRELWARYHDRGVQIVLVDSEVDASPERDAAEARARGYPFPLVIDRGAALAKSAGALYTTYTIVVDADGRVHYAGGIDSNGARLTPDASAYLRDALDDLLSGREPRVKEGKALGCALRTS